jgi:anaerobic nitric oxide reductase flavorubredoxin
VEDLSKKYESLQTSNSKTLVKGVKNKMQSDKLVDGIYRVSAKIGERDLFEGIWPIPNGVMLNSYVVEGTNKRALIDMVKDWEGALGTIEIQLKGLNLTLKDFDYLVLNHMEPDHTGALAAIKEKNSNIEIVCTQKAADLVKAFYKIEDNITIVKSGSTIDLGGKTLFFEETPNIHWPETMVTYVPEDKILFSCDAFGSFGRYDKCFDDQLNEQEMDHLIEETYRYYANIVSSFSLFVLRGIDKLKDLEIKMVAPSHGVVWRKNPETIINLYKDLASYMNGPAEKKITFIYSSMYGNTASLVPLIKETLENEGLEVLLHEVPQEHTSFVLSSAWRSSGLVFGMPTYEYKMFPPMYHILDSLERSRLNNRKVMRFGSYGWSGGAQKQFEPFCSTLKWDVKGVVEFQGSPNEEDRLKAVALAKELAKSVKEWTN